MFCEINEKRVFIKIIPHIANHDFLSHGCEFTLEEYYLKFKHLG